MRLVHGRANLLEYIHDPIERQSLFFRQHVAQRAAVEVLHHQIRHALTADWRKAKVSHVHDVRVAQASRCACLALESFDELFVAHELRCDQLEGDIAFRAQVCGQIHRAHPALAQQPLKAVLLVKHLSDITLQPSHARYPNATTGAMSAMKLRASRLPLVRSLKGTGATRERDVSSKERSFSRSGPIRRQTHSLPISLPSNLPINDPESSIAFDKSELKAIPTHSRRCIRT